MVQEYCQVLLGFAVADQHQQQSVLQSLVAAKLLVKGHQVLLFCSHNVQEDLHLFQCKSLVSACMWPRAWRSAQVLRYIQLQVFVVGFHGDMSSFRVFLRHLCVLVCQEYVISCAMCSITASDRSGDAAAVTCYITCGSLRSLVLFTLFMDNFGL